MTKEEVKKYIDEIKESDRKEKRTGIILGDVFDDTPEFDPDNFEPIKSIDVTNMDGDFLFKLHIEQCT